MRLINTSQYHRGGSKITNSTLDKIHDSAAAKTKQPRIGQQEIHFQFEVG
jgi:hypothetical protein